MDKKAISPFINKADMNNEILLQKLAFRKQMDGLEKELDYFNMIFKEVDEDDSDVAELFDWNRSRDISKVSHQLKSILKFQIQNKI